jgi:hypothetical protein
MRVIKHFSILVIMFFLFGCVSNKNISIYDPSLTNEQSCFLEIPLELTVTRFNDTKVSWNVGFWGTFWGFGSKAIVEIPPGEHLLVADYYVRGGTSSSSARGVYRYGMILSPELDINYLTLFQEE